MKGKIYSLAKVLHSPKNSKRLQANAKFIGGTQTLWERTQSFLREHRSIFFSFPSVTVMLSFGFVFSQYLQSPVFLCSPFPDTNCCHGDSFNDHTCPYLVHYHCVFQFLCFSHLQSIIVCSMHSVTCCLLLLN